MTGARVLFPILIAAAAGAQGVPRQRCTGCHPAQAMPQPATSMAKALEIVAACDILAANPALSFRSGAYSYRIAREGDRSIYTVTDGKQTISVPLSWAFGLGSGGQTYLYQRNGKWYESRVSFYKKLNALDLTIGARGNISQDLEGAAGRPLSAKETVQCFNCHATNAIRDGRLDLQGLEPGVMCERCHGSAEKHAEAIKSGNVQHAAMRKLGQLSGEEMSDFCGQCHRTWSQIAMNGPHDVNNVRFQPYRLTNSQCYDPDDLRIRCVACHDPHREVEHSKVFYDAKCLACHAPAATHAKQCPTATKDCITCHMPKYEIPDSHNLFTDHQIRVVKPGEPYPG